MYQYITSVEQFGNFISEIQNCDTIYLDTETTGLNFFEDKVILIQVKLNDKIFIFDTRKLGENTSRYVVQLIKDSQRQIVGFNLKFDMKMLKTNYDELLTNVLDCMLMEILITNGTVTGKERFFSLAKVTKTYCNVELNKSVRDDFFSDPDLVLTEEHLLYAAQDVMYLQEIAEKQLAKLTEQRQIPTLQLEMRLLPVVCMMELEGIALDVSIWNNLGGDAGVLANQLRQELIDEILEKILDHVKGFSNALEVANFLCLDTKAKRDQKGYKKTMEQITDFEYIRGYIKEKFNLNSSDQLLIVLRDIYNINIESTNEKIINKFLEKHPIIKKIIDYREQQKKVTSFGDNFIRAINPVTGRIHSDFEQLGSQSGRFSSRNPNLQNIPRESIYRSAFIARPGHKIISIDFSQEELRLLAVIARVTKMIEAYKNGIDLHTATGKELFDVALEEVTKEQRSKGKSLNFAVGYGSTEFGLYKNFGIPMEEGRVLLHKFYTELYPEIETTKQYVGKKILEHGYSVTLAGRKRFFEIKQFFPGGQRERDKYIASILREGFNHIVQGTGADIIKESLCRIFYENPFGDGLKILIQVYDEIVCEVEESMSQEALEFIRNIMIETEAKYLKDIVPAEADGKIADCWVH